MHRTAALLAAFGALIAAPQGLAAPAAETGATASDRAFVAKVSQGGRFEVEAGKLAVDAASAQDVKDFAAMEVHDHTLVGDKLTRLSLEAGIPIDPTMNAEFSAKLAKLKTLSGPAFDQQYLADMADLHPKDGAAFLKESTTGGSAGYRAFGAETHKIVQRHIGAIQAAPAG